MLRTQACPSSQQSQTWTGHPQRCQADCLTLDAAAALVLSNDCLNVLGTGATCLVFTSISIEAVGFEVAALELDQALEAHDESI